VLRRLLPVEPSILEAFVVGAIAQLASASAIWIVQRTTDMDIPHSQQCRVWTSAYVAIASAGTASASTAPLLVLVAVVFPWRWLWFPTAKSKAKIRAEHASPLAPTSRRYLESFWGLTWIGQQGASNTFDKLQANAARDESTKVQFELDCNVDLDACRQLLLHLFHHDKSSLEQRLQKSSYNRDTIAACKSWLRGAAEAFGVKRLAKSGFKTKVQLCEDVLLAIGSAGQSEAKETSAIKRQRANGRYDETFWGLEWIVTHGQENRQNTFENRLSVAATNESSKAQFELNCKIDLDACLRLEQFNRYCIILDKASAGTTSLTSENTIDEDDSVNPYRVLDADHRNYDPTMEGTAAGTIFPPFAVQQRGRLHSHTLCWFTRKLRPRNWEPVPPISATRQGATAKQRSITAKPLLKLTTDEFQEDSLYQLSEIARISGEMPRPDVSTTSSVKSSRTSSKKCSITWQ